MADSAVPKQCSPTRAGVVVTVAAMVVLLAYFWTARTVNPVFVTREPGAYYGLLTDAFLSGQTCLKARPDPRLALLANPYLGAQGIPRLHDATYYHDRYYLYFGAAPVIFLFGPWRLLTGTFLTDEAGTTLFAMIGFLAGCALLWQVWRRWFGSLSVGWLVGAVLVWGCGNFAPVLVEAPSVYPVPLTCAFALVMTALLALWQALQSRTSRGTLLWLGLGNFLWACTVAARPNYLVSLPALALPLLALLWPAGGSPRPTLRRRLALLLAAGLPVLAVGAAIAAYNWVRFHNIFEFGVSYMFTGGDSRAVTLLDARRLLANLRYFVIGSVRYGPYFPFLPAGEGFFGLLTGAPVCLLALAFPFSLGIARWRRDRLWMAIGWSLAALCLLNLFALGVFFTNERYALDFVPAAVLLGLISGLFLLARVRETATPRRRWRWTADAVVVALAGLTLVQAGLFALSRYPDPRRLAPVARPIDRLVYRLERLLHIAYGPLDLRITFHPQPGRVEPLVVSGHGRDVLFVTYPAADQVQFGFDHAGAGGPTGEPVRITPGQPCHVVIDLGALYPPRDFPAFAAWTDVQSEVLHRVVGVTLDGRPVLAGSSDFYPASPWDIEIGRNRGDWLTGPRFSGRLESAGPRRIPAPGDLRAYPLNGPVRLTLTIPPFDVYKTQPLISTGHAGAGDLIFLTYLGPDRIRFGHDSWYGGAVVSAPVDYVPGQPCTLEVDMGSLHPGHGAGPEEAPLLLRFNGRLVLQDRRPFYPTTGPEIAFGYNGVHSTAAYQVFSGRILRIENIPAVALPPPIHSTAGPLHLVALFPAGAAGASEPLVVTGQTGAGDLLYVTYLDPTHIRVGYDHWKFGGPRGAPLPVDYAVPHDLEIFLGSLLPPASDPWWGAVPVAERARWRRLVRVTVDGVTALDCVSDAYPTSASQVYVGSNPIGGSTCQPAFTGRIFLAERRGPDALPASPAP